MEDINDIKLMWRELDSRISFLEQENKRLVKTVVNTKYRSTREKLIQKYSGFIIVEAIMIIFMSLFFLFNPEVNEKYRIPSLIYWDCFFLLEVAFDLYLMLQIKSINIYEWPINEVTKKAAQNWKLHKIGILIGLPLAFGAIVLFALALNANLFVIAGMIVGGVIGLTIGIIQLLKFKDYYRLLQSND